MEGRWEGNLEFEGLILINCTYADAFNSKSYVGSPNQASNWAGALTWIGAYDYLLCVKEGVQVDSVSADGQASPVEHPDLPA